VVLHSVLSFFISPADVVMHGRPV